MHHYIKFDFDLGYGYGLPVLIEIDSPTREQLQEYFQKDYSDDEYISFDENYVTVDSIIQSAELFGICPDCDAVMHEEGCIVCQNYES